MELSDRGGSNVSGGYLNVSEQGLKSLWAGDGEILVTVAEIVGEGL